MRTYYSKTFLNKKIFIGFLLISLFSCARPDNGFAPSVVIQAQEIPSTEKVISGNYEIHGTTEEILEKKVSGSVTIEGVFNE